MTILFATLIATGLLIFGMCVGWLARDYEAYHEKMNKKRSRAHKQRIRAAEREMNRQREIFEAALENCR